MTTLDLKDASTGDEWRLYQVQLSEDPTQATADTFNAPGQSSDETFISVLSERETFNLTGLVTAPRLSGQTTPNAYNSDWRTALAEYAQRGEAFCHAGQGSGYTLEERDRGRTTLNVIIEEFSWTYEKGAIYQLSYDLTLRRGDGLLPDSSISIGSATPQGQGNVPTLDGNSLDGFERLEMTKSLGELNVVERAFAADAGENDIWAESGPVREWSYSGRKSGSASTRNSFDDTLRGLIDDNTKPFQTVLPGYAPTVKLLNYESDRQAGAGADSHEYSLTVRESQ